MGETDTNPYQYSTEFVESTRTEVYQMLISAEPDETQTDEHIFSDHTLIS